MLSFLMKIHYEHTNSCTVKTKNNISYLKDTCFNDTQHDSFYVESRNCFRASEFILTFEYCILHVVTFIVLMIQSYRKFIIDIEYGIENNNSSFSFNLML